MARPEPTSGSERWGAARCAAFLPTVRLFQGLPEEIVGAVAARMRPRQVPQGGFVFLEGDEAKAVSLLAVGRVKVVQETEEGREVILRVIQPGDIFGGAGGWGETFYPATAVALRDAVVLQIPAREFTALVSGYPEFALAVIRELGTRLREAEARIRDLQTQRAEQRLARALLRLVAKTGVKTAAGIEIGLPLSRQDLAELAGTTLHTASRTLSAWDRRGLIIAGRERVTIVKGHELVAIAEDMAAPGASLEGE